ncbi:MAG: hypothetical protein FWH56_00835 [Betaproteobacteria bacterium]|nr:hypothetical protein [Betaproteobacteria bacterium]
MAYLSDGNPISYASPAQQSVLELFQREMTVIPVTARNIDAFRRVDIRFAAGAVLNYGGLILDADGSPDAEWLARSRDAAIQTESMLNELLVVIENECVESGLDLRTRIIRDADIPFYIVAKSRSGNTAHVAAATAFIRSLLAEHFSNYDIFIHENHNNLALVPKWLDKRYAVEYLCGKLAAEHGDIVTFGMGDSLIDLNFMSICHYMIVPNGSQIFSDRMGGA